MLDGGGHARGSGRAQGLHRGRHHCRRHGHHDPLPARGRRPVSRPPAPPVAAPGRLARLWRGSDTDPAWARPGLIGLLVATAVLLFWGLTASGWANAFYSAAVQAGSASWKAFFFGSSDAANSITVDKPPASLWVMALSVRLFGLSSCSDPRARRRSWASRRSAVLYADGQGASSAPQAGLLAGAVLALTPVAVLMFRFNNPDALLVLLMTAGRLRRAARHRGGRARWLMLGRGLHRASASSPRRCRPSWSSPRFALAYLHRGADAAAQAHRAPARGRRRDGRSSAGWWVAIVELVPASAPPLHRRLAEQLASWS